MIAISRNVINQIPGRVHSYEIIHLPHCSIECLVDLLITWYSTKDNNILLLGCIVVINFLTININVTFLETHIAIVPGGLFSPVINLFLVKNIIALLTSGSDCIALV